jgi:cullin 3
MGMSCVPRVLCAVHESRNIGHGYVAPQSYAVTVGHSVKEPKSRDVGNDDTFHFNDDFTSKLFKIKIGSLGSHGSRGSRSVSARNGRNGFALIGVAGWAQSAAPDGPAAGLVTNQRDSEPQQQETREKVEEDRKPQIDAAIVRVMKVERLDQTIRLDPEPRPRTS